MICAASGVEEYILGRIRCGWKKFRELLPLLTSQMFSVCTIGNIFQACVGSVVFYRSETWVKLERNDMMMVRWLCNVTLKNRKSTDKLRDCLGLVGIRKLQACIQTFLKVGDEIVRFSDSKYLLYEAAKRTRPTAQSAGGEQLRGRCKPHPRGFRGRAPGNVLQF